MSPKLLAEVFALFTTEERAKAQEVVAQDKVDVRRHESAKRGTAERKATRDDLATTRCKLAAELAALPSDGDAAMVGQLGAVAGQRRRLTAQLETLDSTIAELDARDAAASHDADPSKLEAMQRWRGLQLVELMEAAVFRTLEHRARAALGEVVELARAVELAREKQGIVSRSETWRRFYKRGVCVKSEGVAVAPRPQAGRFVFELHGALPRPGDMAPNIDTIADAMAAEFGTCARLPAKTLSEIMKVGDASNYEHEGENDDDDAA